MDCLIIFSEEQGSHFSDDYSNKSIASCKYDIKRVSDVTIIIQQGLDTGRQDFKSLSLNSCSTNQSKIFSAAGICIVGVSPFVNISQKLFVMDALGRLLIISL